MRGEERRGRGKRRRWEERRGEERRGEGKRKGVGGWKREVEGPNSELPWLWKDYWVYTHTRKHTQAHTSPLTTVNRLIYAHLLREQGGTWEHRPGTKILRWHHTQVVYVLSRNQNSCMSSILQRNGWPKKRKTLSLSTQHHAIAK